MAALKTFLILALVIGALIWWARRREKKLAAMTPEERVAYLAKERENLASLTYGSMNPQIICQQCQTRGFVHVKGITQKKGVSGAKATGALFTGGLSLLATGLSRKEATTQAHCTNCNSTWYF